MTTQEDRHDVSTVQISLYVPRTDKEWITEEARKARLTKSDYIRFLIAYARSQGLTLNVSLGRSTRATA